MAVKTNYRTKNKVKEVDKRKTDQIVKSPQFEPATKQGDYWKRHFFIFRWKGDQIEGILRGPITNLRRNTSYPIELDDGRTLEVFGNKLLHTIIKQNELIGSRVRIVYIGRQTIPHCRPRKIYRIFKITGVFTESETEMHKKSKVKK